MILSKTTPIFEADNCKPQTSAGQTARTLPMHVVDMAEAETILARTATPLALQNLANIPARARVAPTHRVPTVNRGLPTLFSAR